MAPTAILPKNPTIQVNDQTITINDNGQIQIVPIDTITNVYLKKSKMTYIPSFMNTMMSFYEKRYKLFIRTDANEIKIKVKADEKQHFINLIFHIRKIKANLNMTVA